MVNYEIKTNDLKIMTREILNQSLKHFIIAEFILLPITIFFFIVGCIYHDIETINIGYYIFYPLLLLLIYIFRTKYAYVRELNKTTNLQIDERVIKVSIYLDDDQFVIENHTLKTIKRFRKNDIKQTKITNSCLLIVSFYGDKYFFPNIIEIKDFFKDNNIYFPYRAKMNLL